MKKRVKAKAVKSGSKAKSGKKYSCDVCGMVVAVNAIAAAMPAILFAAVRI